MGFSVFVFFIPYLSARPEGSVEAASALLAATQVGGVIARPALGWLSDVLGSAKRYKLLGLLALTAAPCVALFTLSTGSSSPISYVFLVVFGAVLYGWVGLYYTVLTEMAPPRFSGAMGGLGSTMTQAGTGLGALIVGALSSITSLAIALNIIVAIHTVAAVAGLIVGRRPITADRVP
jgi:predicted MFS family arabinose efflux permease